MDYNTKDGASCENISELRERMRRRRRQRKQRRRLISIIVLLVIFLATVVTIFISRLNNNDEQSIPVFSETEIEMQEQEEIEPTKEPQKANQFESFYYYESDNEKRYIEYQEKNPSMEASDVVWRVNANLDKEWYTSDIPVSGYDTNIVVNKFYKVPDNYRPTDLVEADGFLMRSQTASAYKKMVSDAKAEGLRMRAVSAYRSVEYQRGLYNRYLAEDSKENVDRYSARAGYSEHHTGMAIDLFGSIEGLRNFVKTPEYKWVRDNCHKYGFIIRYQAEIENITGYEDEPWHIRYIGVEASTDMKNKGIKSYEEYYEKYIKHTKGE